MKKPKKLRGFTLVELIVAFILLMIVISMSAFVLYSVTDIFSTQANSKKAQTIGNGIMDFVCDKLKFSTDIKLASFVKEDDKTAYENQLAFKDGKVFSMAVGDAIDPYVNDLYGEDYYCGNVFVTLTAHDGCYVDVSVEVYVLDERNKQSYLPFFTKTTTVSLLNVEQGSGALSAEENRIYSSESDTVFILTK